MNPQMEKRQNFLYWLSLGSAISALACVATIGVFQVYIRWKINQEFTFLGGFELEALTISAFALIALLTYLHRSR
jgi:hypothetical protein